MRTGKTRRYITEVGAFIWALSERYDFFDGTTACVGLYRAMNSKINDLKVMIMRDLYEAYT